VIQLNAGGEEKEVSAILSEIFVHKGPEGSASQVQRSWDVYDSWGNRMEEDTAQKILNAPAEQAEKLLLKTDWYKSTALSYEKGLQNRDTRLLWREVGRIEARGPLKRSVRAHSIEMFRLGGVGDSRQN
jgi:alpha-galactosidase